MKKFFKKLFHRHVWKEESREFLREERLPFGMLENGMTTYSEFRFYAIHQKCVDCGETRVIETRTILI